ncbi:MAG: stage III sporulation protein AC [Clostridiales bacterium]|nr:stage III sporulation protein AC [Clostridiales bacterium]
MEMSIIYQIAAIGIIVTIINLVLKSAGRDEQAMMTTLAGVIVVMFIIVTQLNSLFTTITTLFNL